MNLPEGFKLYTCKEALAEKAIREFEGKGHIVSMEGIAKAQMAFCKEAYAQNSNDDTVIESERVNINNNNQDFCKLLLKNGDLVGFWFFVCLGDNQFAQAKTGHLEEKNITSNTIEAINASNVRADLKGYFVDIAVVEPQIFSLRERLSEQLLYLDILFLSFIEQLLEYAKCGVFFDEWGAVFSGNQGRRYEKYFGFDKVDGYVIEDEFAGHVDIEKILYCYSNKNCGFVSSPLVSNSEIINASGELFAELAELYKNQFPTTRGCLTVRLREDVSELINSIRTRIRYAKRRGEGVETAYQKKAPEILKCLTTDLEPKVSAVTSIYPPAPLVEMYNRLFDEEASIKYYGE